MEPQRYRKLPITIEAVQIPDDPTVESMTEVAEWCGGHLGNWLQRGNEMVPHSLMIETSEGVMRGDGRDWIIKGVHGEFYPCKPEVFMESYERVDE